MTPDTAQWTGPISRGDEAAFGRFYDAWFDRAFRIARSISRRDESFCLDVVQDAMMRVVKSMKPLSTEASVEAWMQRTLLSTTVDRLRSDGRRAARERQAAHEDSVPAPQLAALEDDELLEWLHTEIAALPERDQRLLDARFFGGRTLVAAGAAVGLSGNAAHGRLRRIVERLRDKASGWMR